MPNPRAPLPPRTLLPELQKLLETRSPGVSAAIRQVVSDLRPCVRLETARVSDVPLRGTLVDRLLRRPPADPKLPTTASKLGGIPYVEHATDLNETRFLGQINFAEVARALAERDFPRPEGMPDSGLLAIDMEPQGLLGVGMRTRWYPNPCESKAVRLSSVVSVAKYEAAIRFVGSWSLRGLDWFDAVPEDDDELWTYMNDLELVGVDEDARGGHKLLGHPNEALNEHYGLKPVAGRSDNIRDYALLWRIDFDRAAGLSWGTNWIYVVIHAEDLAASRLENAIVTGANA